MYPKNPARKKRSTAGEEVTGWKGRKSKKRRNHILTGVQKFSHSEPSHTKRASPSYGFSHVFEHVRHAYVDEYNVSYVTNGRGRSEDMPPSYLKRLLQYLHGRVLGFCCRPSPFSSAIPVKAGASMVCTDCIAREMVVVY